MLGTSEIIVVLLLFLFLNIPAIFYLRTLKKALLVCDSKHQEMKPNSVFYNLIPVFNIFYHLYTVIKVSNSLFKELKSRNMNANSKPGLVFGVLASTTIFLAKIPILGIFFWFIALLMWIVYWAIINNTYKKIKLNITDVV